MNDTTDPFPVTADDIVDAFWRLAEAAAAEQWQHRDDMFSDEPDHRWWLPIEGQDDDDLADFGLVPVDPHGVLLTVGLKNPHLGQILTDGYGRLIERRHQEQMDDASGARMLADQMQAGGFATLGDMMDARRADQQRQQASHTAHSA